MVFYKTDIGRQVRKRNDNKVWVISRLADTHGYIWVRRGPYLQLVDVHELVIVDHPIVIVDDEDVDVIVLKKEVEPKPFTQEFTELQTREISFETISLKRNVTNRNN